MDTNSALPESENMRTLQTKNLIGEGIEEQTEQALKNLGAILDAAGSSFGQVLKTTVLLTDMGDFAKVNEVYGKPRSQRLLRSGGHV